jgi:ABC-type bacteriocin/lantibiotic exporter with double-glycine peptidase domain
MPEFSFQQDNYSCGAHAAINALRVLKLEVDYEDVKRAVGTTRKGGTTKAGLIRGIETFGVKATEYKQRNPDSAWVWLQKWCATNAVILLVDNRQHWMTAVSRVNGSIMMIDPTLPYKEGSNGVSVASKQEVLWRWQDRICYAIRVSK